MDKFYWCLGPEMLFAEVDERHKPIDVMWGYKESTRALVFTLRI